MITVSYSGIMSYENCPSSFKRRYISKEEVADRSDVPSNSKRARGTRIHAMLDEYLMDIGFVLPKELKVWEGKMNQLLQKKACGEKKWAFDESWESCGFTAEEARIRGILDAICVNEDAGEVEVYEWKTGKKYPDHKDQRVLYGLAGLLMNPEYDRCVVETVYLDSGEIEKAQMDRAAMGSYKWLWERRMNKCQPPQSYAERPNWKCRFCDYSEANGGKCPN